MGVTERLDNSSSEKHDMAKVDVGANVALFGQEGQEIDGLCGEANAQMARNGYPDPADRLFYAQQFLKTIIKDANSKRFGDKGDWGTDPHGLRECLQSLSSAPVNWVICASKERRVTQEFVQKCISESGFPTPVLVNQGFHWVLVVGWETEEAPGSDSPILKFVHYYNPEPIGHGSDVTVAGSTWSRSNRFSKVTITGTWANKFVAVGNVPDLKGG
jgi:hypothetical protein